MMLVLQVEARMFEAVHDMTARGLEDYPTKPRHEWVLQWPGMTVLVVSGIFWTQVLWCDRTDGNENEERCTPGPAVCVKDRFPVLLAWDSAGSAQAFSPS
eukprot:1160450-Pelagomonas_calceolata.AAC.4